MAVSASLTKCRLQRKGQENSLASTFDLSCFTFDWSVGAPQVFRIPRLIENPDAGVSLKAVGKALQWNKHGYIQIKHS